VVTTKVRGSGTIAARSLAVVSPGADADREVGRGQPELPRLGG
jgi:hypothetical protein